jgi:Mg-chelatase subunit ChlD
MQLFTKIQYNACKADAHHPLVKHLFRTIFVTLFLILCCPMHAQLRFTQQDTDLGNIAEAFEIVGDVVIRNDGEKKIFLLRADADKGLKVFTSKKTLLPGDTALLIISFIPQSSGKFNKNISLISSDQSKPYRLSVSGNLLKLKADDKLACFYFGNRRSSTIKTKEEPIAVQDPISPRDISNKIPDVPSVPPPTYSPVITFSEKEEPVAQNPDELSKVNYRPNNILFLVDVSSSMRDSLKLPLMKEALYTLIAAIRDIDKVTFVTYADSVRIISEGVSGAEKERLNEIVKSLKAKGMTKGKKAILKSQEVAQKHFIADGNNQIIMASDGKFLFTEKDQNLWQNNQGSRQIILSTVAFGDEKEALKNLKEIAGNCGGSFIHVKKRNGSRDKLLDEIKLRSRRNP